MNSTNHHHGITFWEINHRVGLREPAPQNCGELPVPLLGYTRAMLYRTCVEQLYYRRPWASEEDIAKQHPKVKVKLDWGKK